VSGSRTPKWHADPWLDLAGLHENLDVCPYAEDRVSLSLQEGFIGRLVTGTNKLKILWMQVEVFGNPKKRLKLASTPGQGDALTM